MCLRTNLNRKNRFDVLVFLIFKNRKPFESAGKPAATTATALKDGNDDCRRLFYPNLSYTSIEVIMLRFKFVQWFLDEWLKNQKKYPLQESNRNLVEISATFREDCSFFFQSPKIFA